MKKILYLFLITFTVSCQNITPDDAKKLITDDYQKIDSTDQTNNFYDNEKVYDLACNDIEISGEINNPGLADLNSLPLRTLIVKEALPTNDGNKFVGAYRYDGYSLFDILNLHTPDKLNQKAFPPVIDLYVIVENAKGEKAVFSWGEIFYPNHLHEIIVATKVMRIVPSKTKELWPLPEQAKIVVGHDLLSSRNIDSPVKITVKSAGREFEIEKGMNPMFAPEIDIFVDDQKTMSITKPLENIQTLHYESIFYGRGRGIHSTTPFSGQPVKEILSDQLPENAENIQNAFLIVAAKDGYRGVYTYSEIFNRNDQAELLLVYMPEEQKGGAFRLFPSSDFFSDRAILSVDRIYFETIK